MFIQAILSIISLATQCATVGKHPSQVDRLYMTLETVFVFL